jgi:hypothetical protein
MKNHFLTIVFGILIFPLFSQESVSTQEYACVYANLQDTNMVERKENGNELIPLNENIAEIFQQFNVFSFRYAFPKIKSDYLKKTVYIECMCNAGCISNCRIQLSCPTERIFENINHFVPLSIH